MARSRPAAKTKSLLPAGYAALLTEVKQRVRAAQIKAAVSANRELLLLYWDIGRAIVQAQKDKGYGKQVVEMLSTDLKREFPEMAGFTARNLWFMRAFFLAYADGKQILKTACFRIFGGMDTWRLVFKTETSRFRKCWAAHASFVSINSATACDRIGG